MASPVRTRIRMYRMVKRSVDRIGTEDEWYYQQISKMEERVIIRVKGQSTRVILNINECNDLKKSTANFVTKGGTTKNRTV